MSKEKKNVQQINIELDEIENESFLPKECLDTKDDKSFFESLTKYSDYFENMLENIYLKMMV